MIGKCLINYYCANLLKTLICLIVVNKLNGNWNKIKYKNNLYHEFSAGIGEKALFPNIFNLATHAEIRSTSTCGQSSPEYYCKLVEHVFLREPQCDICDANDQNKNHPIDYAIDGTRRWWQSPSLSNGLAYENVNITLDLRQEYQVAYVVVKSGISPRPGTWVLEKSLDGKHFVPWQYFAISDSECMRVFGIPATIGVPKFLKDDEVICTSYYSKLNPLEYGEVHISLVNGRPGANHTTVELQEFTKTRFVRLRLIGLRTLHADLMIINRRDGKLDQSVTRRYFYSISDISIGGQCICYGHAERCPPEETHGQFRCECRHNTYGESCNQCLPLFNQLPWKPGTHDQPNICQACQCFNHADRCVYDYEIEEKRLSVTPEGIYEGGGKCINCQHNTMGINCEKCKDEFYRPIDYSRYQHDVCKPCDCDPVGSENNFCIKDETEAHSDLKAGECICKKGFGGRRCNRCAFGYHNYPNCEPCLCNQAGSLNFETCEEKKCKCKANVEGKFCDRCKPGFIYLDKSNPLGCQPCFCFGKSNDCREEKWNIKTIFPYYNQWNLTDMYNRIEIPIKIEDMQSTKNLKIFNSYQFKDYKNSEELFYWKVPLTGNWLNSYGSNIYYYVYFVPNDTVNINYQTNAADVVIEGNNARLEYYSRINFHSRENISVVVPLRVTDNWLDARSRRPIDLIQLMRVLSNVENFFVRSKYYHNQLQSSIYGLRLESASLLEPNSDLNYSLISKIMPVEICKCPEHFEGSSCEQCEAGYRRVENQLYGGICKKCECEDHSQECDPFTGFCFNCQHNTTGVGCEKCKPGYYGNPSLGGELGQCKACSCPTVENSHSATCALSELILEGPAAANEDEFVCTACENGYDGNKCEICADGYFGNPFDLSPETRGCKPCNCSGNIDLAAIGNCNRETGVCLRCINYTTGDYCEKCQENHWGSAIEHNCFPCNCNSIGSKSLQCNVDTGDCNCKEGYRGKKCDYCEPGHGDIENGCPKCECNKIGSFGTTCHEVSGQCMCKQGVYGKHCDKCISSYFNFTESGCQFCKCNAFGAIPTKVCHNITGECQCQANVKGLSCESCIEGYFNISSGVGCEPCNCNPIGSTGIQCEIETGDCKCKFGVSGQKCNKCKANYWGLDENGCKKCQICPAPGQVCDQITGECVCPPNTEGTVCENCASNAWNYHSLNGCELCDCNKIGSIDLECDAKTGQCNCKEGYYGSKCDRCQSGYYNFPNCQLCDCDLKGTEPQDCQGSTCVCTNEGQCKCKKNVIGLKCNKCTENSFSLEAQNPVGCTECFCFNRSQTCSQSNFVWQQIYSSDRTVKFETPFKYYTRKHNIHILQEFPLNYNSYPTNHTPLYWPLPKSFLNDKTNSYNGWIYFRIKNNAKNIGQFDLRPDFHTYRLFPQILLIGNNRIELEYVPYGEIPFDGKYRIHLHELEWRNRNSPQLPLTRKQFMIALQNVQAIYVRATYNDMFRGSTIAISELSMDIAVQSDTVANTTSNENIAIGVEMCNNCAVGYKGASCQNPEEGFCKKRDHNYLNDPEDLALVGWSEPCFCNKHSKLCDPDNCRCKDCDHNTVGDFCEICRSGYYGNATSGRANSCIKCACPTVENSFSETCKSVPDSPGYVCDSCRQGYTGAFCETCKSGYYGNPSVEKGFCAPCACHVFGSVHGICHKFTGQCECREGVSGRDCSLCSPRHAFINGICSSCDQGCYKELMKKEDEMSVKLLSVQNFTNFKPIPKKRLAKISNAVKSYNEIIDNIKLNELNAKELLIKANNKKDIKKNNNNQYSKQTSIIEQEFNLLEERNRDSLIQINNLLNDLKAIRSMVPQLNYKMSKVFSQLSQIGNDNKQNNFQTKSYYLIIEAQEMLNSTRDRSNIIEKSLNYAKKNTEDSEELLKKILSKKLNNSEYNDLHNKSIKIFLTIKDFRNNLWDQSNAYSNEAKNMFLSTNKELIKLKQVIDQVEDLNKKVQKEFDFIDQDVEAINNLKYLINTTFNTIDKNLTIKIQEQEAKFDSLNNEHTTAEIDKKIKSVQPHVLRLENLAKISQNTFSIIQASTAFVASNAYKDIINIILNVKNVTEQANKHANNALSVITKSLNQSYINSTLFSNKILDKDLDNIKKELEFEKTNYDLQTKLNNSKQIELDANKKISWIKNTQQLLNDHHDRITTVSTIVNEAHNNVSNIKTNTENFFLNVDLIKKQVDEFQNFNYLSIQNDINNIKSNQNIINNTEKSLQEINRRLKLQSNHFNDIHQKLQILKEKINEAREKASKIRIGIKSDEGDNCVREYLLPIYPNPSNIITIKYRPTIDSQNSLIFLITTKETRSQSREFIALELKSKKISVKWNIGGGFRQASILKRNIIHIPASERYTWYNIEVKRIANTMQINVVQKKILTGEGEKNIDEPTSVSVEEFDPTNSVIFNTHPGQTELYVGHTDAKLTEKLGLSTNRFHGTIGEIQVDGVNIPLWVFEKSTGNCDGYTGLQSQAVSGLMFKDGFAQVRMQINDQTDLLINIQFSAYSSNGLLYFRGNQLSKEFLAIYLHNGAIELKINYGKISETEKKVAKAFCQSVKSNYADGHVHKIRVIRNKAEIHLQIDQDDRVSTTLVDEIVTFKMKDYDHYVGGVSPNFNKSNFDENVEFEGFYGCIQSISLNQVYDLDLDNLYRSQHVEPGCSYRKNRLLTLDRVISFSEAQNGYVLAEGIELSNNSTFSFNFKTKNKNALLLYQSNKLRKKKNTQIEENDKNDQSFFSFSILNGRLNVHLSTSIKQNLSLTSNQTYNDRLIHSVFFLRTGSNVQVTIDDQEILLGTLNDDKPISSSLILFGSLPPELAELGEELEHENIALNKPFVGCISDFQHNYERFSLMLEEHSFAKFDSCKFDRRITSQQNEEQFLEVAYNINDQQLEQVQNFDRKKSQQSIEHIEPKFSSKLRDINEDLDNPIKKNEDNNHLLVSLIEHSLKKEQTCKFNDNFNKSVMSFNDAIRFGLSESSHARINFLTKPYPDYRNFKLSFSFRTKQKNAILWTWANYKNYMRYFFLNIDNGFLSLVIKGHREPKHLHYKARKFNDEKWHTVYLEKSEHTVNLKVDNYANEILKDAPNPKIMRKRMYIGGVISKHRKLFNEREIGVIKKEKIFPTFVGCIRDFKINNELQNLLTTNRDLIPCVETHHVNYIHNGGFAIFDSINMLNHSHLSQNNVELNIQFRLFPLQTNNKTLSNNDNNLQQDNQMIFGFLSSNKDAYQNAYLILVFTAHFIRHRINIEERFLTNGTSESALGYVCKNDWNHLLFRLSNTSLYIKLNQNHVNLKNLKFSNKLLEEIKSLPVHIGGTTAPVSTALNMHSLISCVKNLEFSGIPKLFNLNKKNHKIVTDSCPF